MKTRLFVILTFALPMFIALRRNDLFLRSAFTIQAGDD